MISSSESSTNAFSLTRMIYAVCGAIIGYEVCGLGAWLLVRKAQGRPLDHLSVLPLSFYAADVFFIVTMLIATLAYRPRQLFRWQVRNESPVRNAWQSVMWGIIGGLVALLIASPLFWRGDEQLRPVSLLIASAISPLGVLKVGVFVLALAVSGEAVYRGIVFRTLERYASAPASLFASCLVFAVVCPVFSYPAAIVLGVTSAVLFYKTDKLLAPIVANALFTLGGGGIMLYARLR